MTLRASLLVALGVAIAGSACDYPEFSYREPSSSTDNATSTSSGPASTAASTSTSTGAGGSSAACEFGVVGSCGSEQKCALVNVSTGELGCVAAGPKQLWQSCTKDADCIEGALCDPRYGACKPVCASASDCKFTVKKGVNTLQVQGECIPAQRPTGTDIAATITHCTSNCEPTAASPCDVTNAVACVERQGLGFDCAKTKGLAAGSPCSGETDCAPGRLCVVLQTTPSKIAQCALWCDTPGNYSAACPSNTNYCAGFEPPIYYEKKEYGTCIAP